MSRIILYFLILLSYSSFSQVQNSNEKPIAEFYDADVKRVTLNGGKLETQFKVYEKKRRYIDASGKEIAKDSIRLRTAEKVDAFFLKEGDKPI